MKRLVSIIVTAAIFLAMSATALAGDIPEVLLSEDGAKVFIGTVESYTLSDGADRVNSKVATAEIVPTLKIKGDVEVGKVISFSRCDFGSIIPEENTEYLFGYCDDINFYIYEIESRDDKNIKLLNSEEFDMVKRLEDYINEGAFARAEEERSSLGTQISLSEFLYAKTFSNSSAEKVILRFNGEPHEIDKDEFTDISRNIRITNIKNRAIENAADTESYDSVLYIELLDGNNKLINHAAVTRRGEVDRYGMFMSRLMAAAYEMNPEDVAKLYSLLPDEALKESPDSADTPTEQSPIPKQTYAGLLTGSVIAVFIIAFAVGYKTRKKKRK